jgi:hypothetical protein
MSERAEALASQFEAAYNELIAAIEACTDSQWHTRCPDEERSVGVVAHHVAGALRAAAGWVRTVVAGQPLPPLTAEYIDQLNAQHAERHSGHSRDETVALLRQNGQEAAALVRGLSDDELDRTGSAPLFGPTPVTAANIVKGTLIAHTKQHLRSIRAALQGQPG